MSWIESTETVWRDLQLSELDVDQAYIYTKSHFNQSTWLYLLSNECYKCPYTRVEDKLIPKEHQVLTVNVAHPVSIKIYDNDVGKYAFENETSLCDFAELNLGEFGVYNLTVSKNGSCNFVTDKEPVNIYLSFWLVFLILLIFSGLVKASLYLYRKYKTSEIDHADETVENEEPVVKKRIRSLDTFRGMSIVLMIFVNSGGGHYWWIEHAPWNGLHVADIVFPSFLWVMGVCIPISIKSQLNRGMTKLHILKNILWRSVKLFLIGLCLNSTYGPKLENLRIMGVLQRFGIAYFVAGSLHTIFNQPQILPPQNKYKRIFFDLWIMKFEWLYAVLSIAIHLGIVFGVAAPGCPKGYLGPGGKSEMVAYPHCIGGIIGYVDKMILTVNHIYKNPTAKHIYDSSAFDPEGLFGCILTIVQVIIGVQCGVTLTVFNDWKSRIYRWLNWSCILGLLGAILCSFSKENGWIPVNKNLWSLSFVFITSCFAFAILSFCYYIIDVKSRWNGSPFRECGMNAIIMYVGHSVLHKMLPWHWRIGEMNTHFLLLFECTWNTVIWIGIAYVLYKKKFFYNL